MQKYIGVKIISAEPQVRMGHPANAETVEELGEGPTNIDGYKVVYEDGYTSWSPKDVFDKAYRPTDGLTFGLAIEAMKLGHKVSRVGWNGSGLFAVLSPGKKGLPASDFFSPHLSKHALTIGGVMDVRPAFMLKTAQEDVAYWAPSGSDCLAEDWFIVE
jgi:hypothetical protein